MKYDNIAPLTTQILKFMLFTSFTTTMARKREGGFPEENMTKVIAVVGPSEMSLQKAAEVYRVKHIIHLSKKT